jgi:hypothetical protein
MGFLKRKKIIGNTNLTYNVKEEKCKHEFIPKNQTKT